MADVIAHTGLTDYDNPQVSLPERIHENGDGTYSRLSSVRGGITDRSGTIATGGTSQQVVATNTGRAYLLLQNPSAASGSLWFNFGAAATQASPSVEMLPGATYTWEGSFVPNSQVTITGAQGLAYTCKEG